MKFSVRTKPNSIQCIFIALPEHPTKDTGKIHKTCFKLLFEQCKPIPNSYRKIPNSFICFIEATIEIFINRDKSSSAVYYVCACG